MLLIGLPFVAVGCGDSASEDGLEQIIESQASGDVEVDLGNDGGLSFETADGDVVIDEDGSFTVTGDDGEVITGQDDGDGGFSLEGESGNFTVNQGSEIPAEWPEDVPRPVGLTITSSSVIDSPQGANVTISGSIDDAAAFVAAYTSTLEAAGFATDSEYDSDGAVSALLSGDGWQVSVATNSIDGQNQGIIALFPIP
jgi:hypothetical protein